MSWFTNLFSGGTAELIKTVSGVVDEFHTSDEEKALAKHKLQALIQKRDSEVEQTIRKNLEAKERILVAELQQGDSYTKRARPTVVYFGLIMIALNYFAVPLISLVITGKPTTFTLPADFWLAWGGIVGTWAVGRSFEKLGRSNKVSQAITGSKPNLLD